MIQGKKEEIQESMIRSALHFWNIKNVENLDPLVRLLIEVKYSSPNRYPKLNPLTLLPTSPPCGMT